MKVAIHKDIKHYLVPGHGCCLQMDEVLATRRVFTTDSEVITLMTTIEYSVSRYPVYYCPFCGEKIDYQAVGD